MANLIMSFTLTISNRARETLVSCSYKLQKTLLWFFLISNCPKYIAHKMNIFSKGRQLKIKINYFTQNNCKQNAKQGLYRSADI